MYVSVYTHTHTLTVQVYYVDPIFKTNVYSALFDQSSDQPWATPQYTCATGNCTWDPTANLAMRALCSNVTSSLLKNCSAATVSESIEITLTRCNITLGSTLSIFYENGFRAQPMAVTTVNAGQALVYQNSSFPVVQYILASGSNNNPQSPGLGIESNIDNNTQFVATECTLQPLVRSVKPFVSLGVYQETILAEWTVLNNTLSTVSSDFLTPKWNNSSGLGLTSTSELFGFGANSWNAIIMFFENIFAGNITVGVPDIFEILASIDGRTTLGAYAAMDTLEALFYSNFSSSCDKGDQLTCAMDNVAAAMSKTIRDTAFSIGAKDDVNHTINTNITTGYTMTTASFVAVRWEWLILPLLVWLLVTVSWMGAALRSRNIPALKNDLMPLLFVYRPSKTEDEIHQQETYVKLDQGRLIDI